MRGLPGALVNRAKSLRPSGKKIPITPRGKDDFHEDSAPGARAADGSRAYTLCRSGVEVERRSVTAPAGGRAHPKLKMTPEMAALTQIQELFRVGPDGGGSPLRLAWSVVRRRGKPLLLLPQNFHSATVALQLYAAQRPAAKAIRKLLPWYAGTPLRALGQQLIIHSNTAMPWTTFLRRQWGGAASRLPTPAILVGNQAADAQRFILLVLDETKSPVAVVKAGLRPPARHIIEREAEVLRQLPLPLLFGAVPPEIADRDYLGSNGVRICLQGHRPFLAAVRACHDTLRRLAEGVPPEQITDIAAGDLVTGATRRKNYDQWTAEFLRP